MGDSSLTTKNKGGRPKKVVDVGGRPSKMTDETLDKLRTAFMIGANDEEACVYADISPRTLYKYQKKNPEYVQLKEQWKLTPILSAKNTVVQNLTNVDTAKWYLERKKKDEFGREEGTTENKQFNFFVNDQQLAEQLVGYFERIEQGKSAADVESDEYGGEGEVVEGHSGSKS